MDMHMKANGWICLESSDEPGFHSKGSLRAHACKTHDIRLEKLKMIEISRDEFEMETKEEYEHKMQGKQGRGGDRSSSQTNIIEEHEVINCD